jgi:Mn-dependent DtxR family transcriptional regulator
MVQTMRPRFTKTQGQYLAFIFYYTKLNGRAPSEADMEKYFRVTPPSVHQMILTLEAKGFIERVPGQGRSIRLLIGHQDLPMLE